MNDVKQHVPIYKKFFGTFGVMLISKTIAVGAGVIYARYLGPEQFGLYSYILSIITVSIFQ